VRFRVLAGRDCDGLRSTAVEEVEGGGESTAVAESGTSSDDERLTGVRRLEKRKHKGEGL
jgi:hypothetical protein